MIDNRLLDCDSKAEIEENLNRILALIDALTPAEETSETSAE